MSAVLHAGDAGHLMQHQLDTPGSDGKNPMAVVEIPTPRWVVYDAMCFGVPIPEKAEKTAQERAYTSPIWYKPGS